MNGKSVVIYLFTFFLSYLFLVLGEKFKLSLKRKCIDTFIPETNKNSYLTIRFQNCIAFFFVFIGLIIPSILAACRATSVGMDNSLYVVPNFKLAQKDISFSYFWDKSSNMLEYGFAVLMYIFAQKANINLFYFIIQFIPLVCIYYSLNKISNQFHICPSLGMLIYYFIFYNFSLSGMRQSLAMPFIIIAWLNYNEKKYYSALIFSIMAVMFHKSSIAIIFALLLIIWLVKLQKKILYIVFGGSLLVILFLFNNISHCIAVIMYYIQPRYAYYINKYSSGGFDWGNLALTDFLAKSLLVLIVILSISIAKTKLDPIIQQVLICVVLGRYFTVFVIVFYEATRIAYYFDLFLIAMIPFVVGESYCRSSETQLFAKSISVLPAFAYWLYFIMHNGAYGTSLFRFYDGL